MSWTAQRHVAIDRQSLGPPGAEQAVAVSSTVVDRRPVAVERGDGRGDLAEMVEDLAGEFYTQPLLRRILTYSIKLLQADAGSISIVNQESGVYRKEVDIGIGCQSGRIFPLNEGVTGQVVARGGPVRFADYSQVPGGHLQVDDSGQVWGVIGVPIVWKNTIVGVFVLFSRDPERQFTEADGNALQVFAKYAALALANAQLYEESEARSRALPSGAALVRPPRPAVAEVVTHGLDFVIDQLWAVGEMVGEQADAQARLELARRAIEATSADVRRVVLGTFPLAAKGPWLTDALLTELRAARGMGRISSEVAVSGDACPLPVALSDHLLYVAREFLDCVIRRPGRHRVTALLTYAGPDVMLSLTDRTDDAPVGAGGHDGVIDMALRAMAERTRLMDGTFRADWPDPGTNRVQVIMPTDPSPRARVRSDQLRVAIVASSPVVRSGIAQLLADEDDLVVVGRFASAGAALDALEDVRPDVTLVDLELRDISAARFIRHLLQGSGHGAAVALMSGTQELRVSDVIRLGARGCVGLDADGHELAAAIRAAHRGGARLTPATLDDLHEQLNNVALTAREREIRALVERGLPDRAISQQLSISVKTVEKHVSSILRKSGAKNRTELAAMSRRR